MTATAAWAAKAAWKAAWEFKAAEREREAFRVGWLRGQKRLAARAGRMAVGMVAQWEWEAAWREYKTERQ